MNLFRYIHKLKGKIFSQNRARKILSKQGNWQYKNLTIDVFPGIFHPGIFYSTEVFLQFLDALDLKDKTLLELGCGTGTISLYAASLGAIVTASDLNPKAVQNALSNAEKNSLQIRTIESDLFENISEGDFDFILINPPYYPKDRVEELDVALFCGKDYDYFHRLFKQLPDRLTSTTKVYMILSEDCDLEIIIECGKEFSFHEVVKVRTNHEWNMIYDIKVKHHSPS